MKLIMILIINKGEFLMDKKLNSSPKRDAILLALRNTTTHPSADWIYEKVKEDFPEIGIATVYRNLKILLDNKEIFKIDVGDGLDHYDANIFDPHDHTFCRVCGAIGDTVAIRQDQLGTFAKDGFSPESYSLILYGVCENCKNAEARKN